MTGGKKDINFLAAQKILSRAGQTTSFEFMLVVATIVVAAAMVGWFLLSKKSCESLEDDVSVLKGELKKAELEKKDNDTHWNNYRVRLDSAGNPEFRMVRGTKVYQYDSVDTVLKNTEERLAGVQAADADIKDSVDLTSACVRTVLDTVEACGCTVTDTKFSGGRLHVSVSGLKENLDRCDRVLRFKEEKPLTIDPRLFVREAGMDSVRQAGEEGAAGVYTTTFHMEVYNDDVFDPAVPEA